MKTIKVLVYRSGNSPVLESVVPSLDAMQKLVGGYIQAVPLGPDLSVICNEDGKAMGLPPTADWRGDVLVGTFFVSRVDEEGEAVDLQPGDVELAKKQLQPMKPWSAIRLVPTLVKKP